MLNNKNFAEREKEREEAIFILRSGTSPLKHQNSKYILSQKKIIDSCAYNNKIHSYHADGKIHMYIYYNIL